MLERELTVSNRLGLHARATAKLVPTLAPFRCNVTMAAKGREINAKSIMGVMLLAAGQGLAAGLEQAARLDWSPAIEALRDCQRLMVI
ncbi:HPr family phosphocarrier protein, partial [Escherichia coli]|uniref:HPr family phosphocarrier protein n=1 Tax=Escherichia coli TaxID=562 RepID=UPI003B9FF874